MVVVDGRSLDSPGIRIQQIIINDVKIVDFFRKRRWRPKACKISERSSISVLITAHRTPKATNNYISHSTRVCVSIIMLLVPHILLHIEIMFSIDDRYLQFSVVFIINLISFHCNYVSQK